MRKNLLFYIFIFILSFYLLGCIKKENKLSNINYTQSSKFLNRTPEYINYYNIKVKICDLDEDYVAKINNYLISKKDYYQVLEDISNKSKISLDIFPLITKLDAIFSLFYVKVLEDDIKNFFKNEPYYLNQILSGNLTIFYYTKEDLEKRNVCLKLNDSVIKTLKEKVENYQSLKFCENETCLKMKKEILKSIKDTIYFYVKVLKPLYLPKKVYYNWVAHHINDLKNMDNITKKLKLKYLGNYTFLNMNNNSKIKLNSLEEMYLFQDLLINGSFIALKGTPLSIILHKIPENTTLKVISLSNNDKLLSIFCQIHLNNNYHDLLFNLILKKDFCVDYNKL